jgi:peptidoglycan hydrolase-like protein with peptidoglycan-binding domain
VRYTLRAGPLQSLAILAGGVILAVALLLVSPTAAWAQSATSTASAAEGRTFTDLNGSEWFSQAVYALAAEGIVQGRQDGSFAPYDPVTRAQMAVFLARALRLPESPGSPFFDVNNGEWFAGAVGVLYQKRLLNGTSPIMFSPDRPISRQQAATLVMRCLGFYLDSNPDPSLEFDLPNGETGPWLASMRDRAFIASAHAASVANAYRLGVIQSSTDGWFYPELSLTRAQMAVILYRAFLEPIQARTAYPEEVPAESAYPTQSRGSEGTLVSFLEARLAALGYICGPVDGVYDNRTRDAVLAFQKVERLKRDGTVGGQVWQHLFAAQTPTPRRSYPGTRAEVDLTRQVLFMITDNHVWKIVHVSSGRLGTRTGHFTVGTKWEGWVEAVTVQGRMYYPSYIVSRTAIHGYPSVPTYPASHGCVRVPVWTAVDLYHELPKGTIVDVYY